MPLDWTEEGMTGQPAGAYLEALRQAAVWRATMQGNAPWPDPGALDAPEHALRRLKYMLLRIDDVAWYAPSGNGGWVAPSAFGDFTGTADVPLLTTQNQIETAAGLEYRMVPPWLLHAATPSEGLLIDAWWEWLAAVAGNEAEPTSDFEHYRGEWLCGPLSGAYLRQLRAVFLAKSIWWSGTYGLRYDGYATKTGRGATAEEALAAYNADPWHDSAGQTTSVHRFSGGPNASVSWERHIARRAGKILWGNDRLPCTAADLYLVAMRDWFVDSTLHWETEDYPLPFAGRCRIAAAVDVSRADHSQWIGRIDAWTGTISDWEGHAFGWSASWQAICYDFRNDWTELA
jgi:hypothetical protein